MKKIQQIERQFVDYLIAHQDGFFFGVITVIALAARFFFLEYISTDMSRYLLPWFDVISSRGGWIALSEQVGDYNVFYQFIIAMFTYLPTHLAFLKPLYLYKYLSIAFDFLLAYAAGKLVAQLKQDNQSFWFNLTYTVFVMLPTVVMNSAMWGQCDSIFSFFLILSLTAMIQKRDTASFVLYGVAMVFKFQAIFLLPFYFYVYIHTRRFSIFQLGWSVLVLWLSGIPAFLNGRNLLTPFIQYLKQTVRYHSMYMNVVSFWRLIGDDFNFFAVFAVLFTMVLFGLGLYALLKGYVKLDTPEELLAVACWTLWTCVLFLPSMHERYPYPRDILLILLAILNRKYIKFAVLEVCFVMITYGFYFYGVNEVNLWHTLISLGLWTWFSSDLLRVKENPGPASC